MSSVRSCRDDETAAIFAIVNAVAEVYRSVIPADRWHEPYMPSAELDGVKQSAVDRSRMGAFPIRANGCHSKVP